MEKFKKSTGETTGIKRNIDSVGRIVLPKEFRETIGLGINDEVEIFCFQDGLYIKKSNDKEEN